MKLDTLRQGRAAPKWRNQSLAWFLSRLQLAQAEGQGIPTIFRSMREEGCPDPVFDADDARVTCTLPAHPRHALAREYRAIEEAISLGEFEVAKTRVQALLSQDSLNARAVQLLVEVASALKDCSLVRDYLSVNEAAVHELPAKALVALADALMMQDNPGKADTDSARQLYVLASKGFIDAREARKLAYGLSRAGDDHAAVAYIDKQFADHLDWRDNPYLLQTRGNSYIGLAKQCTKTARRDDLPPQSKRRAWDDCRRFLVLARKDLETALLSADTVLRDTVRKNMEFADHLEQTAAGRGPRTKAPRR